MTFDETTITLIVQSTTIVVAAFLAVVGWFVGHYLSTKREISQKRREIRVQHLRTAYLSLCDVADRQHFITSEEEFHRLFEQTQRAFNEIQVFGSEEQITLIQKFIQDMENEGSAALCDLLNALRNEARSHIGLNEIDSKRLSIRYRKRNGKPSDSKLDLEFPVTNVVPS